MGTRLAVLRVEAWVVQYRVARGAYDVRCRCRCWLRAAAIAARLLRHAFNRLKHAPLWVQQHSYPHPRKLGAIRCVMHEVTQGPARQGACNKASYLSTMLHV
jgi:hypothetical protein